ncbi:MAG: TIM barrel protein [Clostridia bacterium]|nr:TIM barrel protein [Clostridia bacterium]
MRKIGVNIGVYPPDELKERVQIIKNAGFEAAFLSFNTIEETAERCRIVREAGLEVDNLHSPFDGINNMWLEGEEGDQMLARLMATVDCCALLGLKKTVVHLSSGFAAPQVNDLGTARYDRLVAYGKEKGVQIVFENLRKLANVAYAMERYPEAGFCWDSGHELCYTPGWEFMPLFGDRMTCIHLHDNLGILDADQHLLPFDGARDWERAACHIKASPYDGPIMLEIVYNPNFYGKLTLEQYYARAYAAGVKLRELIENA